MNSKWGFICVWLMLAMGWMVMAGHWYGDKDYIMALFNIVAALVCYLRAMWIWRTW